MRQQGRSKAKSRRRALAEIAGKVRKTPEEVQSIIDEDVRRGAPNIKNPQDGPRHRGRKAREPVDGDTSGEVQNRSRLRPASEYEHEETPIHYFAALRLGFSRSLGRERKFCIAPEQPEWLKRIQRVYV